VPNELQTTKSSISAALAGMRRDGGPGLEIRVAKGWDYLGLIDTFAEVTELARREHVPALVHVVEVTQPQGHSTSGSHERYKTAERLRFEVEGDPIKKMRECLVAEGLADASTLDEYEKRERSDVEGVRELAYEAFLAPMRRERDEAVRAITAAAGEAGADPAEMAGPLERESEPTRKQIDSAVFAALVALRETSGAARDALAAFATRSRAENGHRFAGDLLSSSERSPLKVAPVAPRFTDESVDGRVVLLRCFDAHLTRDPRIVILGEDVGVLGDVNLVYEGLQAKHGKARVVDTGIREATILGPGLGAAMRGLRPIVDIQYVDYFLYALEIASDDLATLRHRTAGGQIAPVIIRTKGHRLQGIWHTGSPMQVLLGGLRGMHLVVPRDMTQAAGFYNTLLRGDDPALVIEVLSGYRIKERVPANVGDFTLPLGVPETIRPGRDLTLVTYGALCRIALEAAEELAKVGIEAEVIDVRTLLPFDTGGLIGQSVARTGAHLVVDEDVPGGASADKHQPALDAQRAIDHLEVPARTLTATASRTPVGNDADHFTKPGRDDVFAAAYAIARERDPDGYPPLFGDA
jgi:pyruvate/2-oxoglutarate/acetoin dehydrogenase E1 component